MWKLKKEARNKMGKKREAKVYIGVGQKGVGKTYQTLKIIDQYVKGNPQVGLLPRKILIFDVNNEYQKYRAVNCTEGDMKKFRLQKTIEARRISPLKNNGEAKTRQELIVDLNIVIKHFYNGCLVLEDLTLIVGDAVSTEVVGSLSTNRHRDLEIITHFQSIAKFTHPKFSALKNLLRLHKTEDSCNRNTPKNNLGSHYKKVRIGEIIVGKRYLQGVIKLRELESKGLSAGNKEYDFYENNYKRFFLHIDFDESLIIGGFTKDEFNDACIQYLQEEDTQEITPLLKLKDIKTGVSKYTYEQAINEKLIELSLMYGNRS